MQWGRTWIFTMDNTDMPKIDQQDTREKLEPDFSPAVREGEWEEGREMRGRGRRNVRGYSSGTIKKLMRMYSL